MRAFANLTADELSKVSGVGVATIRHFESGKRELSNVQLARIASSVGVDARSLLCGKELLEFGGGRPYTVYSYERWKLHRLQFFSGAKQYVVVEEAIEELKGRLFALDQEKMIAFLSYITVVLWSLVANMDWLLDELSSKKGSGSGDFE